MARKISIAAGGVIGLTAVIGILGLFSARVICACEDANGLFSLSVGAMPMRDDPNLVRAKLLDRVPLGSTVTDINAFLNRIVGSGSVALPDGTYRDGLCRKYPEGISCSFPVGQQWFGNLKTGFELQFMLDRSGRLTDARVSPWSLWFGNGALSGRGDR